MVKVWVLLFCGKWSIGGAFDFLQFYVMLNVPSFICRYVCKYFLDLRQCLPDLAESTVIFL